MLNKKNRLTKKGSFAFVYRKGDSRLERSLALIFIKGKGAPRVGFSVSNKIGKATKRNRIKRRLRCAVRGYLDTMSPAQMVFVAKPPILELSYHEIDRLVCKLLQKAGLISNT